MSGRPVFTPIPALVAAFLFVAPVAASEDPGFSLEPRRVVQGSFVEVRVPGEYGRGTAYAFGTEWPLFREEYGLGGLIPIALATEPGRKTVRIRLKGREMKGSIRVVKRPALKAQKLKKLVVTAEGAKSLNQAKGVFRRCFVRYSSTAFWDGAPRRPTLGPVTAEFGTPRAYGGGAGWPHRGIDIGMESGWPVVACEPGKVVLARRLGEYGNVVLLDHGRAVFSSYLHLTSIDVKAGDFIGKGQVLGTVGATGMALGAHLHFGIYVSGVSVDPAEFLERGFRR
jgi:murein DD-endopeptidase MepM/ murein hydrolase activator NlpD